MDSSESSTPGGSKRRLHSGFLTAGAVVAMVLAGLGVAGAQTAPTTEPTGPAQSAPSEPAAPGDDGARKAHCHHRHGPGLKGLATAASTIGVTEEELRTALRDGQSIAQVAQSKDVDVQKVIDAMVAEAKAKLAQAVEDGKLTQAQADAKAANLAERITRLVNREGLPARGHRHGGHRPPAPGGDAPAEAVPSSATVDT